MPSQSQGTIRDSMATGNAYGLLAQSQVAAELTFLSIENCTVTLNTTGIGAYANAGSAQAAVSNSVISHNTTGVDVGGAGAAIWTRQNNSIFANMGGAGTFTGTFAAQ